MCVCSQASHVPLHLGTPPTELEVPLRVGVHAADSGHRRAVVVEARRAALARALELRRAVLARAVETAGGLASLGLGLGLALIHSPACASWLRERTTTSEVLDGAPGRD